MEPPPDVSASEAAPAPSSHLNGASKPSPPASQPSPAHDHFYHLLRSTQVQLGGREISGEEVLRQCAERGEKLNKHVCTVRAAPDREALQAFFAKAVMAQASELDRKSSLTELQQPLAASSTAGSSAWPARIEGAVAAALQAEWNAARDEISRYALALEEQPMMTTGQYFHYLARCVLAPVRFEYAAAPRALRDRRAEALVSAAHVETLRRRGVCILRGALEAAGIDPRVLHGEMTRLHGAGGIPPSHNPCNPGALGTLLRAGAAVDFERLEAMGMTALPHAMRFLQGLPHAFAARGYDDPPLRVPPHILASAYPPAARYERHLDSYGGQDNARQLTFLLYANPEWDDAQDGGCLQLEADAPCETVEVSPLAGTLVAFESARVWHRVLESRRLRFALTLWVWHGEPDEVPGEEAADKDEDEDEDGLAGVEVVRCLYCSKPLRMPMRCGKCKRATYCDRQCQAADWKGHKARCVK
jgi:hypothetical protein